MLGLLLALNPKPSYWQLLLAICVWSDSNDRSTPNAPRRCLDPEEPTPFKDVYQEIVVRSPKQS